MHEVVDVFVIEVQLFASGHALLRFFSFDGLLMERLLDFVVLHGVMVLESSVFVTSLMVTLMFVVVILREVGISVEVSLHLGLFRLDSLMKRCVVNVVVLHSMQSPVFHLVEKLVELMLHIVHQPLAIVLINIVAIGVTSMNTMIVSVIVSEVLFASMMTQEFEVTHIRVLGDVTVFIVVHIVGSRVVLPVIWVMFNAMSIVVLVNMLGMVLPLVSIGVVMAHSVSALRLNVMIFTVLLTGKVTFVTEMRLVIFQVPVTLVEMCVRVALDAMDQSFLLEALHGVIMLIWGLFSVKQVRSEVFLCLLSLSRLGSSRRRGLLLKVVHLLVEKSSLRSHVLLSLSLGFGRLGVRIWIVVVRIFRHFGSIVLLVLSIVGFEVETTVRGFFMLHVWVEVLAAEFLGWVAVAISLSSVRVSVSHVLTIITAMRGLISVAREFLILIWVSRSMSELFLLANVFTAHTAIVFLSCNIVVLVTLCGFLAFLSTVLWSWHGHGVFDLRMIKSVFTMDVSIVIGLHLQHKLAFFDKSLRCAECGGVCIKSGVITLVPSARVKGVEVIAPVEIESSCL